MICLLQAVLLFPEYELTVNSLSISHYEKISRLHFFVCLGLVVRFRLVERLRLTAFLLLRTPLPD